MKNKKSIKKTSIVNFTDKFAREELSKQALINLRGGGFDCKVADWCS